ncbi:LysR family transcriptional regulator, partial [Klebsiella pneumoniae]|uniref:LysR family transcriptional regulator n=1 Tax=Klebsiella pneumoniae TaxID=573 RepID=UPI003854BE05
LSPSAVSRRIRALEQFLGVPLFSRRSTGTSLTAAGQQYLGQVLPAFDLLSAATQHFKNDDRVIRLAGSHSFLSEWLLPRLNTVERDL